MHMRRLDLAPYGYIAPVHLLLLLALGIPSIYVLWMSLNISSYGTNFEFVGLANYTTIFGDSYFWRSALNTLFVVLGVVYSEIILGVGMAALFVRGIPFKRVMFSVVLIPYAISPVVGVLIWRSLMDPNIGMINRTLPLIGLNALDWSVVPAHGLFLIALISLWLHLPFTFILLYAGMLSIPTTVYEAARIDGANGWQTFTRITLPLLTQTILVCMIFRLVFSFRLFSEAWLLTGGGPARMTEVLSVYLYRNAFRYHDFGTASASGWLMVIGSLLIASMYLYFMQRRMVRKDS
jgi:multiple sugar transport system permease protein